ncbi:mitochondrial import inner membrane translocase subunit Tim9-like [Saccostrea echinata]|uniref:mitochondrial import inner membrane translocase subunit Tim9-like n=1 Tax=Saccostrea echinata TaxID=191078 RepID=UPI002A8365F1|nr:mitochondrial import inner membrane translocase subunit Tim9-like [Saccostrea echinata]
MNANFQGTEREVSMLRDVLLSHNIMTERCFTTCITKFRQNTLTDEEKSCIDACMGRYVNFNQRLMSTFFEQQQARMKAIAEEQNAQVPPQQTLIQKT